MVGEIDSRSGQQDLDIAACIPEATELISSRDNVPCNVDSPPLSSIARREYLCRVACRLRQLRESRSLWSFFSNFSHYLTTFLCDLVRISLFLVRLSAKSDSVIRKHIKVKNLNPGVRLLAKIFFSQ